MIYKILFILLLSCSTVQGQITVGLDNWYNAETSSKTGMPFHYLWNDTADSGYSRWGDIFKAKKAKITTVYKPDIETLQHISIYIIADPDSTSETPYPNYITGDDIRNIAVWVKQGGVLVILANDGKHCGLTSINRLVSKFGMVFHNVMLHPVVNNQYEMGAYTSLPDHPVFKDVKKIYMKEVASIGLSDNARPVLTDNGAAVMAECSFGKGFVFAVGDPWIYNEYMDHDRLPEDFENRKAAENLTEYLLSIVK